MWMILFYSRLPLVLCRRYPYKTWPKRPF